MFQKAVKIASPTLASNNPAQVQLTVCSYHSHLLLCDQLILLLHFQVYTREMYSSGVAAALNILPSPRALFDGIDGCTA